MYIYFMVLTIIDLCYKWSHNVIVWSEYKEVKEQLLSKHPLCSPVSNALFKISTSSSRSTSYRRCSEIFTFLIQMRLFITLISFETFYDLRLTCRLPLLQRDLTFVPFHADLGTMLRIGSNFDQPDHQC